MDDSSTNHQRGSDAGGAGANDCYAALVEGPSGSRNEALLGKVRHGGFSWGGFFLGPLYWAYRRCYPVAVALTLVNFLTSLLPIGFLWLALTLVVDAASAVAFPRLYRRRAERLHSRALRQGADGEGQAVAFVRSRGGTSWAGVAVILAIAFVLAGFEVLALGLANPIQAPAPASTF